MTESAPHGVAAAATTAHLTREHHRGGGSCGTRKTLMMEYVWAVVARTRLAGDAFGGMVFQSEEERFTVSSRGPRHRSPARGRIRPRTTSSSRGTRRRIRKRNKRGGRTGGYHTETAMTDASNGYEKSGYNSTGGRRNRGAPDSDSDDAVPTRKAKRRGRKAKGSVKKPPKNLPPGWSAAWDGQYNRYYFYNSKGVVTWDKPAE